MALELDRRKVFLGGTAAAGMLMADGNSAPALGQSESAKPKLGDFAPKLVKPDVSRRLNSSRWLFAKEQLVNSDLYPWLNVFKDNISVDTIIFNTVSKTTSEPLYDPYQIENLTQSASTLLDRCLTYRREMYDLEAQAVRRAAEYDLFNRQYQPQLEIELSERSEKQRSIEKSGQTLAANKFSEATANQPLGAGFSAVAESSADSLAQAIAAEQERKNNVKIKWEAMKTYQLSLQDRHGTPGHSLNYGERFDRIRTFLEQDISIAYQKCRCLQRGLKQILGLDIKLEAPLAYGYLDVLVKFVRQVIDEAEIATVEEVDFEHVVSCRSHYWANGAEVQPIVGEEWTNLLVSATGKGSFVVDLTSHFPESIKRVRVKAVGLSVVQDNNTDAGPRLRSYSAVVFPPDVPNLFSSDSKRSRPPLIIEKVCYFDPTQTRLQTSEAINNIDPKGKWTIQMSSNMWFPDTAAHARAAAQILDVKVHMKLTALLDKNQDSWKNFAW